MKNYLYLVAGAALSLASCSQEKTTETTTTAAPGEPGTTTTTTSTTMYTDEAYKARSQRIADKYVADMKISDPALRTKIRTAYYDRSKRYGEVHTKFASDTTGMAAALREANAATDAEFKTIYTDPAQYQSYEASRTAYDENQYMSDNSGSAAATAGDSSNAGAGTGAMSTNTSTTTTTTTTPPAPAAPTAGGTVSRSKTKMTDGSKIKVKSDGKVKVKDGDGSKM